jgi:hypothetical protein
VGLYERKSDDSGVLGFREMLVQPTGCVWMYHLAFIEGCIDWGFFLLLIF